MVLDNLYSNQNTDGKELSKLNVYEVISLLCSDPSSEHSVFAFSKGVKMFTKVAIVQR